MLDPRTLRLSAKDVAANLARRGFAFDADAYLALDERRKALQIDTESLRAERNQSAKSIGQAKARGEDVDPLMAAVQDLGDKLDTASKNLQSVQEQLGDIESGLPNMLRDDVPDGEDESENKEIRSWGDIPEFDFETSDHVELGVNLGLLDLESASRMSGSRFVVLHAGIARLQRALIQFMLDVHTSEHGYNEVYVPYLVQSDALFGTGQMPKFEKDLFRTTEDNPYYLIPTAEVPVTNLVRQSIVDADRLPLRYVAHTPCFRSEAGAHGKDTRGIIRQHQFEKVELVQIVRPDESDAALEALTGHAEAILRRLELPYRTVALCSGDVGFSAAITYDIEVWFPAQATYREISSCSSFTDFQARRMQARWRNPDSGKPELLHTLNGSGVAAGRALIAVMENYQRKDGSIRVPEALLPYMNGQDIIDGS